MTVKIHSVAREQILDIWAYTERTWGEEQADRYVRGLIDSIHTAQSKRHQWRSVLDEALSGIFFIRYRHHFLFFRELSNGSLGVISILHENMDIPTRLKEDSQRDDQP